MTPGLRYSINSIISLINLIYQREVASQRIIYYHITLRVP